MPLFLGRRTCLLGWTQSRPSKDFETEFKMAAPSVTWSMNFFHLVWTALVFLNDNFKHLYYCNTLLRPYLCLWPIAYLFRSTWYSSNATATIVIWVASMFFWHYFNFGNFFHIYSVHCHTGKTHPPVQGSFHGSVATGLAFIMTSECLSLTRDIGPSNHARHVHLCDGVLLVFFKSSIRLSYAINCPLCSVFILLFKKEKPTTKTVDRISSGRWAYTAAHWNVAVIALDMKCVNMWSICWILLNSYLFNCVITFTYSCFNIPFLFSLILVIREHCFCFWTCCCTGLCFIYISWGFISLIFQAGRCPGQAGPIAGQNWAASLL